MIDPMARLQKKQIKNYHDYKGNAFIAMVRFHFYQHHLYVVYCCLHYFWGEAKTRSETKGQS